MIVAWGHIDDILTWSPGSGTRDPLTLLSAPEHRRLGVVTNAAARREMAAARVLLRRTLESTYEGTDASEWMVGRRKSGAPSVDHPRVNALPEVSFSHAAELCAVALSPRPVGVDVEPVAPRPRADALIRRFFGDAENKELFTLDEPERQAEFVLRWTVREAWTKVHQMTLMDALNRCSVTRDADGQLVVASQLASDTVKRTVLSTVANGHRISAVGELDGGAPDNVDLIGRVEFRS